MLDYIDHTKFVYRTAYPFSYKPAQVHICLLPYRFVVFGFLRLLLSLIILVLVVGVTGTFIWTVVGIQGFLTGNKFVFDPTLQFIENGPFPSIIGAKLLDRVFIFNYRMSPIKKPPVVAGKRILPWHVVIAIAVLLALWYILPVMGGAIVTGAHGVWAGVTWAAAYFMELSLWIPIAIAVGLTILAAVIHGIVAFRNSEVYALLLMSFKARMDKICPIIPVK